jgi:hypothetical protein
MICLRKVSYGDELRIEQKHNCKDAKEHSYMVDVTEFIRSTKKIDPTTVAASYKSTMPNGQTVYLEPMRFSEFVRVMQASDIDNHTDPVVVRDQVVDSLSSVISRVDEVTDHEMIKEWLRGVKPLFLKQINESLDKTVHWGPEFKAVQLCKDCGEPMDIVAPMNPLYFFT